MVNLATLSGGALIASSLARSEKCRTMVRMD